MPQINLISAGRNAITPLLLSVFLVGLQAAVLPFQTAAAPPVPAGAEKCAECHAEETAAWQVSPHARAVNQAKPGAACEDCHGLYVAGHPDEGVMQLRVDSSICQECHANTFRQWENSMHAQAGVQCIGCHLSHSQQFRLTDQALCSSCHRERSEDFQYTAHGINNVACIDCHLSPAMAVSGKDGPITAPRHDFVSVSSLECTGCHGRDVHTGLPKEEPITNARMLSIAESIPALTSKLEMVENENRSLQLMAPVAFGLGMGIGGMMGIIFALIVGYIYQKNRPAR